MQPIFSPEELDLKTDNEREAWNKFVHAMIGYANGKEEGVKFKAMTAGAAALAKVQQSRSAMAMVKYDMQKRGQVPKLPAK